MANVTIPAGETEVLISETEAQNAVENPDNNDGFRFEVIKGRVKFGHSRRLARKGIPRGPGSDGAVDPKGEPLFVYCDSVDEAEVFYEPATFMINIFRTGRSQGSEVESFDQTVGTTAERSEGSDGQVLQGAEVLVHNKSDNATVYVGDSTMSDDGTDGTPVPPGAGKGYGVSDADRLYLVSTEPGTVVNISHEVR